MINKKIFTVPALWLATATFLHAAPLTVAVYDFHDNDRDDHFGNQVSTLITADLTTETNLALVNRAQINKAVSELALDSSGMVSADTAAKIGKITGAKVLVSGEVMKMDDDHLIVVANIIGTETGRLFADKAEGTTDNLMALTSNLSRKIAQTIGGQAANLTATIQETEEERLERIIKNISGTNRPSISVNINWPQGKSRPAIPADTEFGRLLLQAGFPVVDGRSDSKPDIEINGLSDSGFSPREGGVISCKVVIQIKVQDRHTGKIIALEHQAASVADTTRAGASREALVNAVDALAEKILPLLAK